MLVEIGLISEAVDDGFSISNVVATANLGKNVYLNALAVGLGLESVEYEPEQFPGLVYRPQDLGGVILVFGSGKVVVTGAQSVQSTEEFLRNVRNRIRKTLSA